jgi:hypothetical protein
MDCFLPVPSLNGPDTENPERMDMVEVSSDELKPIPASIVDHTTYAGGRAERTEFERQERGIWPVLVARLLEMGAGIIMGRKARRGSPTARQTQILGA